MVNVLVVSSFLELGMISNFTFEIAANPKPRIKRLSSGVFVCENKCFTGQYICQRYINYVNFLEVSSGAVIFGVKNG